VVPGTSAGELGVAGVVGVGSGGIASASTLLALYYMHTLPIPVILALTLGLSGLLGQIGRAPEAFREASSRQVDGRSLRLCRCWHRVLAFVLALLEDVADATLELDLGALAVPVFASNCSVIWRGAFGSLQLGWMRRLGGCAGLGPTQANVRVRTSRRSSSNGNATSVGDGGEQ
jgi:hypothetical protein